MSQQHIRYGQQGFTLVELMVALLIFSLLAVASLGLLRTGVDGEAAAREVSEDISRLRRVTTVMRRDFSHMLDRSSRATNGNIRPAFIGDDDVLAGFTRNAAQHLGENAGSEIVRIEYRLRDRALTRTDIARPDGAENGRAITIFDDVSNVSVRYRNSEGRWVDRWESQRLDDVPVALEWTISRQGRDDLILVMIAGTGYRI